MQEDTKQRLNGLAEEDYRVFSSGLLPGTANMLGVRQPLLRKMARQLSKSDWREYLRTTQDVSFEEIMMQGMIIGCAPCSIEERLSYVRDFVPKIDNWSVCDSFCAGLKFTKDNIEQVWDFLQTYFNSEQEFDLRFMVVMDTKKQIRLMKRK